MATEMVTDTVLPLFLCLPEQRQKRVCGLRGQGVLLPLSTSIVRLARLSVIFRWPFSAPSMRRALVECLCRRPLVANSWD